jgi:D-alanyl-D-alanine carboxypeptidase (penicillin-binding protein 5/6)
VVTALAVVAAAVVYFTSAVVAPLPQTALTADKVAALAEPAAQLSWPSFGGSAITVENYPGVTIANGSSASVPIASMTKTITALVVPQKKPIASGTDGPDITFTKADVAYLDEVQAEGGSWAPVVAGSTMTEKQALESMLLPSANNYAMSLASWAYGSIPAFVTAANAWLAQHGLTGTHLVDASGFDPGSVSDPADLISIGKMVLADPVLSAIVDTKETTVPGAGTLKNTNALLGVDGIDGIKTGNTTQAGYCLMFASHVKVGSTSLEVVGAVLGASDHAQLWAAVKSLLTSVKAGFHEVTVVKPGQSFGTYTTVWGSTSDLVADETKKELVWSDTPVDVHVSARPVVVGLAGEEVGRVTYTLNGTTETVPLKLSSAIAGPGLGWRLEHPGGLGVSNADPSGSHH